MILDLHVHSKKSEDSRATVVGYLQWLLKKKDILPVDGLVLTEHRQFDSETDYRHLEDEYGIRLTKWNDLPRAAALVAAVAHSEFTHRPLEDFVAKMAPNGIYVDVKSQADAKALRARGIEVWRL